MTRARVVAYGLVIETTLPLPEAQPIEDLDGALVDVRIRLGEVSEALLNSGRRMGPFLWCGPNHLGLRIPGVATYLVRGGAEILVDPAPGADSDSVRVFLLGSAFGALLHQRGGLVLHGAVVSIPGGAAVCVGPSGAGKSTLAAAFLQRGCRILADDVAAIDPAGRALPGFPRIKLWPDAAEQLGLDPTALRRIRPQIDKIHLPVETGFAEGPVQVRRIYVLNHGREEQIGLRPLKGLDAFAALRANTYRARFLDAMGHGGAHLTACADLARQARVLAVERPAAGFRINALADRLLDDMAEAA